MGMGGMQVYHGCSRFVGRFFARRRKNDPHKEETYLAAAGESCILARANLIA
jgi:hypothetical protein